MWGPGQLELSHGKFRTIIIGFAGILDYYGPLSRNGLFLEFSQLLGQCARQALPKSLDCVIFGLQIWLNIPAVLDENSKLPGWVLCYYFKCHSKWCGRWCRGRAKFSFSLQVSDPPHIRHNHRPTLPICPDYSQIGISIYYCKTTSTIDSTNNPNNTLPNQHSDIAFRSRV